MRILVHVPLKRHSHTLRWARRGRCTSAPLHRCTGGAGNFGSLSGTAAHFSSKHTVSNTQCQVLYVCGVHLRVTWLCGAVQGASCLRFVAFRYHANARHGG